MLENGASVFFSASVPCYYGLSALISHGKRHPRHTMASLALTLLATQLAESGYYSCQYRAQHGCPNSEHDQDTHPQENPHHRPTSSFSKPATGLLV